jgi:hypothetical protein
MSTMDAALGLAGDRTDDDVQRWLAQAFAAERAPRPAVTPRVAAQTARAGSTGAVRGFYWSMLALSLLGWLFA